MLDLGLFGISSKLQHWARQPSSGGICNSSLVLVGTSRWEFETGPKHIPTFQEKVTHSYTNRELNRPDFGQNFDKVTSLPLFFLFIVFCFSNFLRFKPILAQTSEKIEKSTHSYTKFCIDMGSLIYWYTRSYPCWWHILVGSFVLSTIVPPPPPPVQHQLR